MGVILAAVRNFAAALWRLIKIKLKAWCHERP
jgi:hypothetical protein